MKKDYTFYVPSSFMPIHMKNLISSNFIHILSVYFNKTNNVYDKD
jgi:hypothetical protein